MNTNHIDQLNQASMSIILHAGNARDLYNEALHDIEAGKLESYKELLDRASDEIVEAHKIQTRLIQDAIEQEHPDITVLFIHAQDTLMTVDSEFRTIKRIVKLYCERFGMEEKNE